MEFRMKEGLEILSTTPAVLSAMLAGKSAAWLAARTTPEAFNSADVIGHLIHAEHTDWIPRVRIILENGDARTFDPFDRFDFQTLIASLNQPRENCLLLPPAQSTQSRDS